MFPNRLHVEHNIRFLGSVLQHLGHLGCVDTWVVCCDKGASAAHREEILRALPWVTFIGKGQGLKGVTVIHTLVWIGHRLVIQEAKIVIENVETFAISFISTFLSPIYFIDTAVEEAVDHGNAEYRKRFPMRYPANIK